MITTAMGIIGYLYVATMIGILFHELGHATVAVLLREKISEISVGSPTLIKRGIISFGPIPSGYVASETTFPHWAMYAGGPLASILTAFVCAVLIRYVDLGIFYNLTVYLWAVTTKDALANMRTAGDRDGANIRW